MTQMLGVQFNGLVTTVPAITSASLCKTSLCFGSVLSPKFCSELAILFLRCIFFMFNVYLVTFLQFEFSDLPTAFSP